MKIQKLKPSLIRFSHLIIAGLRVLPVICLILLSAFKSTAQQDQKAGWIRLTFPKYEMRTVDLLKSSTNVYSIIIMSPKSVYCYENFDLEKGTTYSLTTKTLLRSYLMERNRPADNNVFLVKGSSGAFCSELIDILNLLNETKTRLYAVYSLTEAEQKRFSAPDSIIKMNSWRMPDTIPARGQSTAMIYEFKGDTVFFSTKNGENKREDITQSVAANIEELGQDLQKAREAALGGKMPVYIIGDKNTRYKWLMKLVDLLRQNELYRFFILIK